MMHIVFISNEYPLWMPGGKGTFIQTMGRALVQKGHKVTVLGIGVAKEKKVLEDEGVRLIRLRTPILPKAKYLENWRRINKEIKAIHKLAPITLVETSELDCAYLPKVTPFKKVIRLHGGHHFFAKAENRPTEYIKAKREIKSFANADFYVAVSAFVAAETKALLSLQHLDMEVIYNPIDSSAFYKVDANQTEEHSIFFAGTLVEKKGIRQLIQALSYLKASYPNLKLYVAGRNANIPGTNTPYLPVLLEAVTDDIKKHVEFLGVVPHHEIPKYIEKAHVCCYPSHMEAMPLAWLEVLAMGKTFIGSIYGPGPETVAHGITGLLADAKDPKDIAEKIRYVFEHREEAIAMGANARKRILSEFDIDHLVEKNIKFYTAIL